MNNPVYKRGDVLTKDGEMTTVITDVVVVIRDVNHPFVSVELGYPDETIPHMNISPLELAGMLEDGWSKKVFK